MREAWAAATGRTDIFSGDIWVVPDHRLTLGDYDPATRTLHRDRPVLVVQGDDDADNATCQTVLVMPLSSQRQNRQPWEDELQDDETPLSSGSIVKVQLIQPIPRRVLLQDGRYEGAIATAVLRRIRVRLLRNLGIT